MSSVHIYAKIKESVEEKFQQKTADIIIIGAGAIGLHLLQQLTKHEIKANIKIFGGESHKPYNRVQLSKALAGDIPTQSLFHSNSSSEHLSVTPYWNTPIHKINHLQKIVTDSLGCDHSYTHLILATGSNARTPDIEGKQLDNIFTFRTLDDMEQLQERQRKSQHTVILGCGLLGLETAKAMCLHGTKVTCIDRDSQLLPQYIDEAASNQLRAYLKKSNINVITNRQAVEFIGDDNVKSVRLSNGEIITCDTVVLSMGIVPNIELAQQSNIPCNAGIIVNETMETQIEGIYAIGECAEYNGKLVGVVAPGLEQANVLADNLIGNFRRYRDSQTTTKLKVADYPVLSVGFHHQSRYQELVYQDPEKNIYRKIFVQHGRLVGAIATGEWENAHKIQSAVEKKAIIWTLQIYRFLKTGNIWHVDEEEQANVAAWPANCVVCDCTGVTRGTLSKAIKQGDNTPEKLCQRTGASSVCGSCKPHLQALTQCGGKAPTRKQWRKPLFATAIFVFTASLVLYLLPAFPHRESIQQAIALDTLWRDAIYKQISGFSLVALSIFVLLLSIRKRIRIFNWGGYTTWRLIHAVTGGLMLAIIFLHTGFSFGSELNFWLMTSFSGLLLFGAMISGVISQEKRLPAALASQLRKVSVWTHIILFWPIPALLTFHIIKTYYF